MADTRTTILRAVAAAERLHRDHGTSELADRGAGRIDVFNMLRHHGIPLLFRPLGNLLGAYLDTPSPGIIVTTKRPLSVQRFTAAHEFGHAVLKHPTSADDDAMLTRTPFVDRLTYDLQEAAADAFASELLAPSWLVAKHMTRQRWTRDDLANPEIVYQLSLRLGVSYSGACYALAHHRAVGIQPLRQLLSVQPRDIKIRLSQGVEPQSWHGDVWLVTERDQGLLIEGTRSDLVVVQLAEHSGSGYVWRFDEFIATGLKILADHRTARGSEDHIGGVVDRNVVAQPADRARGDARLNEVRQWLPAEAPLHSMTVSVDLTGPVPQGLLEAERLELLAA